MARVFLYAPQDFRNLCLLARTLEAFGCLECGVFDPHGLVREKYGRARTRELRVVSAGAFEKIRWTRVDEPERFFAECGGRVIMTVADPAATPLSKHPFARTDLLVFGPEGRGLPADVVASGALAVTIPLAGVTKSLNLVVAVGIVLFEVQRQLG